MDASELRTYEFQLSQVDEALRADPENSELKSLRGELANLIELTRQLLSESQAAKDAKSEHTEHKPAAKAVVDDSLDDEDDGTVDHAARRYTAGQEVTARYTEDGKFYPARVVSVAGTADDPLYTILFHKYGNTQVTKPADMRERKGPLPTKRPEPAAGAAAGGAASASKTIDDKERERRRLRNEKKRAREASRVQEHADRQNAWLNFAKKGQKKGLNVSTNKSSMFKTPDDPYAKGA
ncbi:hypothetical protein MCUN1_001710 [Malassezia cuniculi]|uniref:Tudor domain-containing protein n=1 Tax=Malassezia cuniculi TaxID=948313 RepID=A0AAF0EQS9_9BASI|nr:hypothetical protein MCUN1_001710 [Malassezia cuniculi]